MLNRKPLPRNAESIGLQGTPKTLKQKIKKALLIAGSILGTFLIACVLFIKFDTTAAANFTDNVLRPIFGAQKVLFLEKIFFNAQDQAQQLEYAKKAPEAPQFQDQASPKVPVTTESHFDLTKVAPNSHFSALKNEGVWSDEPTTAFPNKEVMAHTFVRPDDNRSFAIVTLLKIDMSVMNLGSVAGTKEPGGSVGKPGPGLIPADIIKNGSLMAAFDGGFQYRDGEYGMIVGDTTYLPLQQNIGTLVGYKDGNLKIVKYTGQSLGDNITFIRQNCPILVDNGDITINDEQNKGLWGRTFTSDIFTWRSGIGLDKDGNLIFAVGNNLTPATLATALKMGGATNALQLDINPNWVRFNLFSYIGNGKYTSNPLTHDLKDGSPEYLNGNTKDFFYLYKKSL